MWVDDNGDCLRANNAFTKKYPSGQVPNLWQMSANICYNALSNNLVCRSILSFEKGTHTITTYSNLIIIKILLITSSVEVIIIIHITILHGNSSTQTL